MAQAVDCNQMFKDVQKAIGTFRSSKTEANKAAAREAYNSYKAACMGMGKLARTINHLTLSEIGVNITNTPVMRGGRRKTHRRTHKRRGTRRHHRRN